MIALKIKIIVSFVWLICLIKISIFKQALLSTVFNKTWLVHLRKKPVKPACFRRRKKRQARSEKGKGKGQWWKIWFVQREKYHDNHHINWAIATTSIGACRTDKNYNGTISNATYINHEQDSRKELHIFKVVKA